MAFYQVASVRVLVSRITWCAPCRADNVVISAYGFQGPRAFVISAVATSTRGWGFGRGSNDRRGE